MYCCKTKNDRKRDRKPRHTKSTFPGSRVNTERNTAGTLSLREDLRLSSKKVGDNSRYFLSLGLSPSFAYIYCLLYIYIYVTLVLPGKFHGLLPVRYTLMPGIHDRPTDNIPAGWTRNVTMLLLLSYFNSCQ